MCPATFRSHQMQNMAISSTNGRNPAAITTTPHSVCSQSTGGRPKINWNIGTDQFETASPAAEEGVCARSDMSVSDARETGIACPHCTYDPNCAGGCSGSPKACQAMSDRSTDTRICHPEGS